jgi:hypothetical protein
VSRAHDDAAKSPLAPDRDLTMLGNVVGDTDRTPRRTLAWPRRLGVGLHSREPQSVKTGTRFADAFAEGRLKGWNGFIIDAPVHPRNVSLVREQRRHQVGGRKIVSRSYPGNPGGQRFISE